MGQSGLEREVRFGATRNVQAGSAVAALCMQIARIKENRSRVFQLCENSSQCLVTAANSSQAERPSEPLSYQCSGMHGASEYLKAINYLYDRNLFYDGRTRIFVEFCERKVFTAFMFVEFIIVEI